MVVMTNNKHGSSAYLNRHCGADVPAEALLVTLGSCSARLHFGQSFANHMCYQASMHRIDFLHNLLAVCVLGARVSQRQRHFVSDNIHMHFHKKNDWCTVTPVVDGGVREGVFSAHRSNTGSSCILGNSSSKSEIPISSALYSLPFLNSAACLTCRAGGLSNKLTRLYFLGLWIGFRKGLWWLYTLSGRRDFGRAKLGPSKSFCPSSNLHPKCKLKLFSLQREAFCLRIFKYACQVRAHHG